MKIEFCKISFSPKPFLFEHEGLRFEGTLRHVDGQLFELDACLAGDILLVCDRTGEEYLQPIEEHLCYMLCNGIYTPKLGKDDADVVEFFDGFVDIEFLFQSEVESIQLGYHVKDE